jgi:hypothetical protein
MAFTRLINPHAGLSVPVLISLIKIDYQQLISKSSLKKSALKALSPEIERGDIHLS